MHTLIKTDRLNLRPLQASDFEALVTLIDNPAVARMLALLSLPYDRAAGRDWLQAMEKAWQARTDFAFAILGRDGTFLGCVALHVRTSMEHPLPHWEIGYWLGEPHWGKGYMTEAAQAVVDAFAVWFPHEPLVSGYFSHNGGSAGVLAKLGFTVTGHGMRHNAFHGDAMAHTDVVLPSLTERLTAAVERFPQRLESERLILRLPLVSDAAAIAQELDNHNVTRMTGGIPHPFAITDAWTRIGVANRYWTVGSHKIYVITDKAGGLIGQVGLHPARAGIVDPSAQWELGYWIAEKHWGKGYATEAARTLLAAFDLAYPTETVSADHFMENPQSGHVLEKNGFYSADASVMLTSIARNEPAPGRRMLRPPPQEAQP